jgi:hypothetical protein
VQDNVGNRIFGYKIYEKDNPANILAQNDKAKETGSNLWNEACKIENLNFGDELNEYIL